MELANIPCTKCKRVGGLEIFSKLEAKPLGSYSIAGAQVKFSATKTPWMRCNHCKAECRGKRA